MKASLLIFFVLLFAGCKKITEAPKEACFIPYVDFVAFNVNPSTLEVSFTAITSYNGTIKTHNWDFGDGTSFNGSTPPTHKYPPQNSANGSVYRIKYTVSNECGEAYWTKDVNISPCLANVKFSYTVVNDSTIQFTNSTTSASPVTYEWNFGDGTTSTSAAASFTKLYRFDGRYNVTLKATNACGENFFIATVPVCTKPVPAQTITPSGCATINLNAAATKNGDRYQWNLGNGVVLPAIPSTASSISYTYPAAGNYTVTLKVINKSSCDSATLAAQVNINSVAVVANRVWSFTSDDLDVGFKRDAVVNATSYLWNFGDGTSSTLQNPSKTYSAPGVYQLTLTATNVCSSDSFKTTVSIPFYKSLSNSSNTRVRQVVALSPQLIYFLGTNGKLYRTDTAGNWSGAIDLPSRLTFNGNTKLFKDVSNNLWIFGRGEVAKLNVSTNNWTSSFSVTGYSSNTTIEGLAIDNAGVLWTVADNEVRKNNNTSNISANVNFNAIVFAPVTGRIWATSNNRSSLYYTAANSNTFTAVTTAGITSGGAGDIKTGPDGNLFFTVNSGITSTDGQGVFLKNYNTASTSGLLAGPPADFSFDNEGNLWVVYGDSVLKIPIANSAAAKNYSYTAELNNVSSADVLNVAGSDNDIIITKTTGNAVVQIK
ncbi:MAG: PKD domain-containing protein [Bacteroidota bacterium]